MHGSDEFLARSADPKRGVSKQTYARHITGVTWHIDSVLHSLHPFIASEHLRQNLCDALFNAAQFHDLGKLEDDNQKVLCGKTKAAHLPINHVDAGVAYLLAQSCPIAATLVSAHHTLLPNFISEQNRGSALLRDDAIRTNTDTNLGILTDRHSKSLANNRVLANETPIPKDEAGAFLRVALSALVYGDHTDAAHPDQKIENSTPPSQSLRPDERLNALDRYVKELEDGSERSRAQSEIYHASRDAKTEGCYLVACDSPVGTGKTTAVMAHLLKQAQERGLKRIFVVLPFTSIISQSVEVYRKALTLPGEAPEQIVAELHHKADFESEESRRYASQWNHPIIVTTAVAFFETMAAASPSWIKRLWNLPGSAVFVDEAHAALPAKLLPLAWRWMVQFGANWSCYWILASGSLNRFWEIKEMKAGTLNVPDLLPEQLRKKSSVNEKCRVQYEYISESLSLAELVERVHEAPGPRLLVANTVQSAAVIARSLKSSNHFETVFHLSTALTPSDREHILNKVRERLKAGASNWVLVGTSCIEAGLDFSFKTGFREIASLVSLLQMAGRVNRRREYPDAKVFSFTLQEEDALKRHPALEDSGTVLKRLFEDGTSITPDVCTKALQDELRLKASASFTDELLVAEATLNFPKVENSFKVINTDTRTVVICPEIITKIEHYEDVSWQEIQRHSVQLWSYKINNLRLQEIKASPGLFKWTLDYDSDLLGYMQGILTCEDIMREGGTII